MSHSDDCPSRREAERRGERDYETYGYRRWATPYDGECPEAARAYIDGQRYAEYRADEEAAERAAEERRQEERRAMQAAYESECYERAMQEQYERDMQAQYEADMAEQHAKELDTVAPPSGPRRAE